MDTLFRFFEYISQNYGGTFATSFLLAALILFGLYFIIKTFPELIKDYIQKKLLEDKDHHTKWTNKRKVVSSKIQKLLSELLLDTNTDRVILYEFSNGSSNLAGLPFLFVNATGEAVSVNTQSISHLQQKINISILAPFILDLEKHTYQYIYDLEAEKNTYPLTYSFIGLKGVKSVFFQTIYGINNSIGFLVLVSTENYFTEDEMLQQVPGRAQQISSWLNLDYLNKNID